MSTSKHLITALEKSDWLDRLLILAGLAFFVLTVLFILKQRLVDRSIRIALWWTRFIPDFGGDEALLKMEEGSAVVSSVLVATTSVVTTIAASLSTSVPIMVSVTKSRSQSGVPCPSTSDVLTTTVSSMTELSRSHTPTTHDTPSKILESLSATCSVPATPTLTVPSPCAEGHDEL